MALELTKGNFKKEVLESAMPVIVDFWAPWCPPCRMVGPIIEELSAEYAGKVKIGKLNVDTESEVASTYGVQSIPTILFFRKGVVVESVLGAVPKTLLIEKITKNFGAGEEHGSTT